jgi:hypothetical protein
MEKLWKLYVKNMEKGALIILHAIVGSVRYDKKTWNSELRSQNPEKNPCRGRFQTCPKFRE